MGVLLHLGNYVLVVDKDPELVAGVCDYKHVIIINSKVSLEVRINHPLQPKNSNH